MASPREPTSSWWTGPTNAIYAAHAPSLAPPIRHLRVDPDLTGRYGKVNGVVTGVRAAHHGSVVVADDDVRYALARRRAGTLAAGGAGLVALAEAGRRRAGGAAVFPASCSLFAPAWLAERALCAWLAVGCRLLLGGVPYAGTLLSKSANTRGALRRRQAGREVPGPRRG